MGVIIPLWASLSVFAGLYSPLSAVEVDSCPPYTQGYVKGNTIHVCPKLTTPRQEVIKHETVHLIQANLGGIILPQETLNFLVYELYDESEILAVLTVYDNSDYIMEEFEARLLQDLPLPVIMLMYNLSEGYAHVITSSSINIIHL